MAMHGMTRTIRNTNKEILMTCFMVLTPNMVCLVYLVYMVRLVCSVRSVYSVFLVLLVYLVCSVHLVHWVCESQGRWVGGCAPGARLKEQGSRRAAQNPAGYTTNAPPLSFGNRQRDPGAQPKSPCEIPPLLPLLAAGRS